jgi:serine/threonine protein kinase
MIYRNELPRALTRRYEISGVLGHGAFGTVFAGRDPRLDRHVAIKVVRADIDSFVREARALALLSHPHIVSIYDFDHDRGYCWFAMEKLSGGTLRSRLPGISAQAACAVALAQAAALEHAHRSQVLHRDIKPDNTLFDEAGRSVPKVADRAWRRCLTGPPRRRAGLPVRRVTGLPSR